MTAVKRGQAFEVGSFPGPKRGLEFAAASARVRLRLTSLRIISSETYAPSYGPWEAPGVGLALYPASEHLLHQVTYLWHCILLLMCSHLITAQLPEAGDKCHSS